MWYWFYYEYICFRFSFDPGHAQEMAKGGVLIGSIISAIIGYIYLRIVGANRKECHIGLYHNC